MARRRTGPPGEAAARTDASGAGAPRFMSVRQVAEYLQVHEKKVYALAAEGGIPGTKVTGKWLFPRDLVDQWLLRSSHGGVLTDRLIVAGSDDPLLQRLVATMAADLGARALVAYTATGTGLGLELLGARRADVCGIHWGPAGESHIRHPGLVRGYPEHHRWVLVRAFLREQGLVVARGLGGEDVASLLAGGKRWAFRQAGSGSQRFLEETLAAHRASTADFEPVATARSEREAASLVAMGTADVVPGVRGAATEAGVDFVAAGWEAFDFALHEGVYFRALFQRLLEALRGAPARDVAAALGGYDLEESGRLVWASGA